MSDPNVSHFEHTVSSITSTLLARARARDQAAWDRVVDLYGPLVYHWCRGAKLTADDARDVSQEVFIAVSRNLNRFRRKEEKDTFLGWLHTITDNKIRDFWRRNNKEPAAKGGSTAQAILRNTSGDPLDSCESVVPEFRELYVRIAGFVRHRVSDIHWEVFWRVTVQEEPASDVAELLGLERHNVYKIKSRVLRMLREEFGETI